MSAASTPIAKHLHLASQELERQGPPIESAAACSEWLFAQARACGFAKAAMACAPITEVPSHALYEAWLAADLAGEMTYLVRDAALRRDPRLLCAQARGVLSLAVSYHHPEPPLHDAPLALRGTIARYARAEDYHLILKRRLAGLAERIAQRFGQAVAYRICVDTAPLLERALGERAGLGFIGKNTLLITPGVGSFTLLAELLVELDLASASSVRESGFSGAAGFADQPIPAVDSAGDNALGSSGKCGSCRKCLDVCPTGALTAAHRLDARRCIAYLTIENSGPIPLSLRRAVGTWIFGCDLCQEVCPWNASPMLSERADPELRPRPWQSRPELLALLALGQAQVRRFVRRTALRRLGRNQLLRNVAVALGNIGTPAEVPALCAALEKEPPLVRQHIAWALGQIGSRHPTAQGPVRTALLSALTHEADSATQEELRLALSSLPALP